MVPVRAFENTHTHSNKNMRNLDNQMMLYFSDKSLIFKLYYYILVNTRKKKKNFLLYTETNHTYTGTHISHGNPTENCHTGWNLLVQIISESWWNFPADLSQCTANWHTQTLTQVNGYHHYNYILALSNTYESSKKKPYS